jgi:hypothetical protein
LGHESGRGHNLTSGAFDVMPGNERDLPFYESPEAAAPGAPRLLLVSHAFPPDPAVGGLRWSEMGRYFAHHGWAIDVISRDFSDIEDIDMARLERLDIGFRIYSVSHSELLLLRIQRGVWPRIRHIIGQRPRGGVDAISQQEIFNDRGIRSVVRAYHARLEFANERKWSHRAAALGGRLAAGRKYSAVVSSGPPHFAHEAARLISVRTGTPHVVDMRDPWSLVQRLREEVASPAWIRRARAYERRIIKNARLVTMNTPPARDAMRAAYPEYASRIDVVLNGSDDEPLPPPSPDSCFRVRFAGFIYMDRDPRPLFKAARRVIDMLRLTPDNFLMEFMGHADVYANTPIMLIAGEEGVADFVRITSQRPRRVALEFLAGATMLLSLPQDSDYAVPAKIFEYVRFHAWMLVFASAESATAQVLRSSDANVVEPDDIDAITGVLAMRYEQFANGTRPEPVGGDGRFDRSLQAEHFLDLLEEKVIADRVALRR